MAGQALTPVDISAFSADTPDFTSTIMLIVLKAPHVIHIEYFVACGILSEKVWTPPLAVHNRGCPVPQVTTEAKIDTLQRLQYDIRGPQLFPHVSRRTLR